MEAASIRELYDNDPRPTFIVDCRAKPATIHHINTALFGTQHIAQSLHQRDAFRDWWDPSSKLANRYQGEFCHGISRWTKFACRHWLIVSLVERSPRSEDAQSLPQDIKVFLSLPDSSPASIALYEEEVRNRKCQEEQAEKDREALSAEVATLAQEASDVAEKLQNFHDIANGVGLAYFEFDANGHLTYANVSILLLDVRV